MICTFFMPVHTLCKIVTVHAIIYLPLPGSLVYYFLIKNSRLLPPIARFSYGTLLTCNRDAPSLVPICLKRGMWFGGDVSRGSHSNTWVDGWMWDRRNLCISSLISLQCCILNSPLSALLRRYWCSSPSHDRSGRAISLPSH